MRVRKRRWEDATARAVKVAEEKRDLEERRERERQEELVRGSQSDSIDFIYRAPPGLEREEQTEEPSSPSIKRPRRRERIVLRPEIGMSRAHGIHNEGYDFVASDDDDEIVLRKASSGEKKKKKKKKRKRSR